MWKDLVKKVTGPGLVKQKILMGILELEGETLTCEHRLALTLSFAPPINFNYPIAGLTKEVQKTPTPQQKHFSMMKLHSLDQLFC